MARRAPRRPFARVPPWLLVGLAALALVGLFLAGRDGGGARWGDGTHERLPPGPTPPIPIKPVPPSSAPRADAPAPRAPAATLDVSDIGDADERAVITAIARAIDRGGPFAYRKDGAVFGNREAILPARPRGHWREYTVPTLGESDRGPRRIVAGRDGELFYTRDHYRTFYRIRGPTRR